MTKKCKVHVATLLILLGMAVAGEAQKIDMDKLKGMKPRSIGPAAMSGLGGCVENNQRRNNLGAGFR